MTEPQPRESNREHGMGVFRRGEHEWRIEPSRGGIPLVFGAGRHPHDPPRVATGLEVALAEQLQEATEALEALWRLSQHDRMPIWIAGEIQNAVQSMMGKDYRGPGGRDA